MSIRNVLYGDSPGDFRIGDDDSEAGFDGPESYRSFKSRKDAVRQAAARSQPGEVFYTGRALPSHAFACTQVEPWAWHRDREERKDYAIFDVVEHFAAGGVS